MRVAHFCDSEPARADGIAASVGLSVELLRAAGHEVHHFYPGAGMRSVPLPFRQIRLAMPWSRPAPEVDVVHVHSTGPVGMAGFHLARTRGLPLVLTWHTDLVAYAGYFFEIPLGAAHCALQMRLGWTLREHLELTNRDGQRRARLIVLGGAMMAAASVVIAPSAKTAAGLSIFGELPPVHTIPTPVVLPPDATTRAELRAELGLAPDAEVILSVGRVTPEKNPGLLLRAFAVVGADRPGARLVIVGVRQRRRPVRALIRELGLAGRVLLVPPVPRERIGGYYRMADVLAFASTTDTQSLVLSEAESLGLPVVVADAALGPRPGEPSSTRPTCDPTPERLAAAIRRLLDDQDFRVRTQQAGLHVAYTPADHLALLLDAYDVSRRSRSPRRTEHR